MTEEFRMVSIFFENADIEIIIKRPITAKQVVGPRRIEHCRFKHLIFVIWKQWNETDFSFQYLWSQVQQESLMSLKLCWIIG